MKTLIISLIAFLSIGSAAVAQAQEMPADYKQVLDTLGKQGDFKDGVLKVNIPRSDLKVSVDGVATPTPFGFGGWVALEKGSGGMNVMMGDLVLTESELNPVMSALLTAGLEVTVRFGGVAAGEPASAEPASAELPPFPPVPSLGAGAVPLVRSGVRSVRSTRLGSWDWV